MLVVFLWFLLFLWFFLLCLTPIIRYVSRMSPEQDTIYYLCAPSRTLAEQSPYYETFKEHDREVKGRAGFLLC